MTNEEALDYFEHDVEFCKENTISGRYEKDIEADLVAIEAIEKQIKIRPPVWHYYLDGRLPDFECPRCKNFLITNQPYCETCGQALDWTEFNETYLGGAE